MKTLTFRIMALLLISSYVNGNEVKIPVKGTDDAFSERIVNPNPAVMSYPEKYKHYETDVYGKKLRSENLNDINPVDTTNVYYRMQQRDEKLDWRIDSKDAFPRRSNEYRK